MSGRDSLANVKHISDAVATVFHDLQTGGGRESEMLKTNPGKGLTNLEYGMERVKQRAWDLGVRDGGIDRVVERTREQYAKGQALCESPIERSMLGALVTGYWGDFDAIPPLVHEAGKEAMEMLPSGDIVIVPQMAFVKFRFDFGIVAVKDGHRQIVDVECDGAAFHRDAVKERFRVAYLKSWNIPVFKFSGTLLHEDAIAAADVVIGSICRWRDGI